MYTLGGEACPVSDETTLEGGLAIKVLGPCFPQDSAEGACSALLPDKVSGLGSCCHVNAGYAAQSWMPPHILSTQVWSRLQILVEGCLH